MSETDRLAEIKARWAWATPGPWYTGNPIEKGVYAPWHEHRGPVWGPGSVERYTHHDTHLIAQLHDTRDTDWPAEEAANREAISHAPTDVAYLVAEVERLRTVMEKARLYIGLWDATDVCYEGHETEEQFRERENQMLTLGDLREALRRALEKMAKEESHA